MYHWNHINQQIIDFNNQFKELNARRLAEEPELTINPNFLECPLP